MSSLHVDRCRRCHLSMRHPLAHVDASGLCGPCRRSGTHVEDDSRRAKLRSRMEKLFSELSADPKARVLLAFSGGKDSSWTLLQLRRRYGLRVRAVTVDNGFLSAVALENAGRLAAELGADHVVLRPDSGLLRRLFRECLRDEPFSATALARASSVCNACIAVVKSLCLDEARAQGMKALVWGWSLGQLPLTAAFLRMDATTLGRMRRQLWEPIRRALGSDALGLGIQRQIGEDSWQPPTLVSPLALLPYDEERAMEELEQLGWKRPHDVDPNSTNCRLNALASRAHMVRHGFHPYALEIAGLVRSGALDPSAGDGRLAESCDVEELLRVADELELEEDSRREIGLLSDP